MLAKLFKNEFIQTGRMYLWILGIGVVGGGLGALFTMNQNIGAGQFVAALLWNCLLILAAWAIVIIGLVVILVSTNRSLFTERGYLTFSLPVSSTQMLFAKFVANVVFMLLTIAETAAVIYVAMFVNLKRLVSNVSDKIFEQLGGGAEEFKELFSAESLGLPPLENVLRFAAFLLVVILVFLLLAMVVSLFVFTISHVRPFQAVPGLWIPIFFVACTVFCVMVTKFISDKIQISVPLYFTGALFSGDTKLNMTIAIVMLGLTVTFFFLTNFLVKKKISLK